ncbi:23S rRNA (guanosine(2251)-2'-O)-methyltransferase RlmB [bacterium (Candidatus Blackallbacteria) CG17_big_fil_post_rev_8_21_14_2_50_48_46]|uniref:23S rRNA (Guanosine(2251)-2'-O)-methyltransferase RlmB n=1 Tax=bacterium (Candidatus Blackallbacteria) CG17_big_fil_post_rev_8_21_14_2_50_48_46 TaxID=2014261 RepID=A0A2M7G308_9BACT|nr:MAG: 23S rRNA (guanosine(2251)-2'-O)-methyltransferase RlmB [bacterium (Candidatus Blackallbacteria) CG18_big_fil_WC_8_21_14_2_50_49_26]PIW16212.1 MAG: 23S rRNA (guanosine(2251)-2'-O)-methyltransferase RlmB [bacterium (Candidatus Blackallbacteria) CG17_big_fil_post_rev_8_21_14_2_50_48_46]PIW49905.1 MAG: 23S rRNA (guanosine(2251)-2'-O)-methyltransferase RlmB [bacterium (Candidatus Blackallbacteria) CG13_big_fil_rev_8_21_14_2_50_49_14]
MTYEENETNEAQISRIYGKHPVRSALKSERPVYKLWLANNLEPRMLKEFQILARERSTPVQVVPPEKIQKLCPGVQAQGIVADTGSYEYLDWEAFCQLLKDKDGDPFVILLDQVQDPHNLGAILRTAEAAGADGVVIPRHGGAGLTEGVAKASAGAIENIPVVQVTNLSRALEDLQELNIWSTGFALDAKESYFDADLTGPVALVVGSEHKGLRPNVGNHCDRLVHIPMQGDRSLNASVAASLAMYEVVRQRLRAAKA